MVAKSTVTDCDEVPVSVTVKSAVLPLPPLPSVTVTSSIASVGALSSSVIEPVPVPSRIVALTAFDSETVKLSSISSTMSPLTTTVIVMVVSPAPKVSVPEASL